MHQRVRSTPPPLGQAQTRQKVVNKVVIYELLEKHVIYLLDWVLAAGGTCKSIKGNKGKDLIKLDKALLSAH